MKIIVYFFIGILSFLPTRSAFANTDFADMVEVIEKEEHSEQELLAKNSIYMKNGILFCTGSGVITEINNKAAFMMEQGNFKDAAAIIENNLQYAALFFPFRYNLGICYYYLNDLHRALLHFKKAENIVPEYSQTYFQIGNIYQRWDRDNEAIEYYRKALSVNRKELDTYIMIGDLFFKRNRIEMAKKYYDTALKIDPRFPNGLLGRAKIYFKQGQYVKAIVLLKSIDTSKQYDKAYHYYYGESSFKLKDYRNAAAQYETLLKFKSDAFFLTNSYSLILHKYNLSVELIPK